MKTIATSFVFMCALTFVAATAFGQITIVQSDVSSILAVGHSQANQIDTAALTLNIGHHGQNTWDFSSLQSDSTMTLQSVAVSGTPFAGQFPGSTHAFQTSFTYVLSGIPIPVTAYIYFQLSSSTMLNPGEGANGTLFGTFPGTALITNIPAYVFYTFPLTLGTTWTSTYLDTSIFSVPAFSIVQTSGVRHFASYIVDAYGPMKLPDLSVHDALRIKNTDSVVTYSNGTNTIANRVSYTFLARDGASVQVTAAGPLVPDSGTILIAPKTPSWNGQMVALPIQLASFNASQNTAGAGVLLRWSTLSEVNNYGFEVQRGALSGGDFVTVSGAFIPGHGTTTVPRDYSYTDMSAQAGIWYYRLKQIDLDGAVHYSDPAKVAVHPGVSAQDVPAVFSLGQNFPNPFNPETTIRYSLPSRSHVLLAVYNALGERVAVLAEGEQESGFHEVRFDGSALASGVYFYRLQSTGFVQTKKLSLLK